MSRNRKNDKKGPKTPAEGRPGPSDEDDADYNVYDNDDHDFDTFDISICLNCESPSMSVLKLLPRMGVWLGSPDVYDDDDADDDHDDHNGDHDCVVPVKELDCELTPGMNSQTSGFNLEYKNSDC